MRECIDCTFYRSTVPASEGSAGTGICFYNPPMLIGASAVDPATGQVGKVVIEQRRPSVHGDDGCSGFVEAFVPASK